MKSFRKRTSRIKNPLALKPVSKPAMRRPLPRATAAMYGDAPRRFGFLRLKGRKFHFTWKKLLIFLGVFLGVTVLGITAVFAFYVKDLPNPKKLRSRTVAQSTKIVDRNDKALYTVHGDENRTIVTNENISDNLKKATVAVENDTFYTDHGISFKGIARAVLVRMHLLKDREAGGGSTITQQYVRNALSEIGTEETGNRKIREIILSIEVDRMYSKDEILTGYLNEISYGYPYNGIEAAAQGYFGKPAKELNLSESATLAAIPNNPSIFSLYGNNLDLLFERKNYILDRMVRVGYISQDEAEAAKEVTPKMDDLGIKEQNDLVAPHFVFYVREQLAKTLSDDPQTAEKMLEQNGYKVKTSLDLDAQNLAQKIVSEMGPEEVRKYNATNASLTAVDPKTGEVLAMVGSIDYKNSKSGNTNFATANLQPGSSFKPIVFATAFGPKYTYAPGTVTYDVATDFGGYKPNNYNGKFNGAVTNRTALAGSLNIPAVKNLGLVGVTEAIETAKKLGVSTLNRPASDYGLSLVLGSGEVKAVEMAGAYGTFANGGMNNTLRPILTIEQASTMVKDFRTTEATKAVEPEVAYEISSILSDNLARSYVFGTKNNLTLGDRPVAAKSGTTENNRDAWTIGFTPSISVAVWVGNNDAGKTMVKGADGSYVAAPIWNRFMKEYLNGKPVEQFTRPDTIKEISVDKLSGKLPTDQSPQNERVTDIFAPWQIPKEKDDIHVKVRVVTATGKLATDLTPADQTEERTYFSIHSERPNDPRWEEPVQAWARATYGDRIGSAPTEKDDVYVEGNRPSLSFVTPTAGSMVNGIFMIRVTPNGNGRSISKVDYSINNVQVGTATADPWSISYDASSLPPGTQTIQATVTNDLGLTKIEQITVTTAQDGSAPGNVSNATGATGKVGSLAISLSWVNPSDSDLASVAIYQSTKAGVLGDKVRMVGATPNSGGSVSFSPGAGKYYYTLRPVDATGNENVSVNQVMAQMLP